ncbi:unnamed protein product [Sphagnum jensenii]|uniref:Secreted protein n=1 Tax=Sphagnum jensenii TaxID=128206 RepID=A0ABP0X936_9BRYO
MYSKLLVVCNLLQLRIELLSSLFCDDNTHTDSSSGAQKSRFPNSPLPNLAQDCLQISDVAIGTLDDCYTFLLGDKTRRTAILSFSATRRSEGLCRSKRFALAGGTSPGWPTLDGPLWLAVCERRID